MTPSEFIDKLRCLKFRNTFNPYSDRCPVHDHDSAPDRRCESLLAILEAASGSEIDSLWIGRDLGYKGGRRTGLALTDDLHLDDHAGRWGVRVEKPTKSLEAECTAAVVWNILNRIDVPVFLWNVFPLHPHEPHDQFTNRKHNPREEEAGEELLCELIRFLKPRRLVPIGKDAASVADRLREDREVLKVRHPSYGGRKNSWNRCAEYTGSFSSCG